MKTRWAPIIEMPEDGNYYTTKIDDANGIRNIQELRRQKNLFFSREGMYVYYTPTHFLTV